MSLWACLIRTILLKSVQVMVCLHIFPIFSFLAKMLSFLRSYDNMFARIENIGKTCKLTITWTDYDLYNYDFSKKLRIFVVRSYNYTKVQQKECRHESQGQDKEGVERSHRPNVCWCVQSINQTLVVIFLLVLSVVDLVFFLTALAKQRSTFLIKQHLVCDSASYPLWV